MPRASMMIAERLWAVGQGPERLRIAFRDARCLSKYAKACRQVREVTEHEVVDRRVFLVIILQTAWNEACKQYRHARLMMCRCCTDTFGWPAPGHHALCEGRCGASSRGCHQAFFCCLHAAKVSRLIIHPNFAPVYTTFTPPGMHLPEHPTFRCTWVSPLHMASTSYMAGTALSKGF